MTRRSMSRHGSIYSSHLPTLCMVLIMMLICLSSFNFISLQFVDALYPIQSNKVLHFAIDICTQNPQDDRPCGRDVTFEYRVEPAQLPARYNLTMAKFQYDLYDKLRGVLLSHDEVPLQAPMLTKNTTLLIPRDSIISNTTLYMYATIDLAEVPINGTMYSFLGTLTTFTADTITKTQQHVLTLPLQQEQQQSLSNNTFGNNNLIESYYHDIQYIPGEIRTVQQQQYKSQHSLIKMLTPPSPATTTDNLKNIHQQEQEKTKEQQLSLYSRSNNNSNNLFNSYLRNFVARIEPLTPLSDGRWNTKGRQNYYPYLISETWQNQTYYAFYAYIHHISNSIIKQFSTTMRLYIKIDGPVKFSWEKKDSVGELICLVNDNVVDVLSLNVDSIVVELSSAVLNTIKHHKHNSIFFHCARPDKKRNENNAKELLIQYFGGSRSQLSRNVAISSNYVFSSLDPNTESFSDWSEKVEIDPTHPEDAGMSHHSSWLSYLTIPERVILIIILLILLSFLIFFLFMSFVKRKARQGNEYYMSLDRRYARKKWCCLWCGVQQRIIGRTTVPVSSNDALLIFSEEDVYNNW